MVRATRLGTLCQPRHALGAESRADHRHVFGDRSRRRAISPPRHPRVAQQDDPCTANQARRLGWTSHDATQLLPLLVRQLDVDGLSHAAANGQGQDLIPHGRRCTRLVSRLARRGARSSETAIGGLSARARRLPRLPPLAARAREAPSPPLRRSRGVECLVTIELDESSARVARRDERARMTDRF